MRGYAFDWVSPVLNKPVKEQKRMVNIKSLREQIYLFLKQEMQNRRLIHGEFIDTKSLSAELGISKTPLRDALIQLEVEGFVTIIPRRGIMVNRLTLKDIKNIYQIIGALEYSAILAGAGLFKAPCIKALERSNAQQKTAIKNRDFKKYYQLNVEFHDVFLSMSDNEVLKKIIMPLKQRLYDFPLRNYMEEWELQHMDEHQEFINLLKDNEVKQAADVMRDKHWSYGAHEKYFTHFYELNGDHLEH